MSTAPSYDEKNKIRAAFYADPEVARLMSELHAKAVAHALTHPGTRAVEISVHLDIYGERTATLDDVSAPFSADPLPCEKPRRARRARK